MKRRVFLLSGLAGLCAVTGWRFADSSDERAIEKVLYKRLHYLRLDPAGVRRYARDLTARHTISSLRLHALDAAGPLYTDMSYTANGKLDDLLRHGEERVVTPYLMSSDFFFANRADERRVVHYLGFYDALSHPCASANPFARPVIAPHAPAEQG